MKLTLAQQIALRACDQAVKQAQQQLNQVLEEIGAEPGKTWDLRPDGELVARVVAMPLNGAREAAKAPVDVGG